MVGVGILGSHYAIPVASILFIYPHPKNLTGSLTIGDRRVKAQLVEALAKSRNAHVGKILCTVSRILLKKLC